MFKCSASRGTTDLTSDCSTNKLQATAGEMVDATHFSGKNFKMWSENVVTTVDSLRPDIVRLIDGERRPTGELAAPWDRAINSMYAILCNATIKAKGVATVIDETRYRGAGGHGKWTLEALVEEKYRFGSGEVIRDLMDELRKIKLTISQDPDERFLRTE